MSLSAETELRRIIEKERFEGAFFFFGEASRLREEGVEVLVEAALEPATRDFNLSTFRGGSADPEELAAALAMPPMMAPRRVVVLRDAQELTAPGRSVVEEAVGELPPELTFIVSARIPKGSKASLYKTLKARCRTLDWSAPRAEELPGWAMERAADRYGLRLPPAVAQALAQAVAEDLSVLDAELSKLASSGEDAVTLERARALVPNLKRVDRWEWLDGVASRRYGKALADLPAVLAADGAVGLLASMVDQHVYIGLALEGGAGLVRKVLGEVGKPYLKWKARTYAGQARAWSASELERALRLMRRADRQAKTGAGDAAVLQELLLSLRLLAEHAA